MALNLKNALLLLSCLSVVLADFAAEDLRRFQKASSNRPLRTLRPLRKQRPVSAPNAGLQARRGLEAEEFRGRPDGAEYDEYGNRKKQRLNRPRGYDRYQEEPSAPVEVAARAPRPRYNYPAPQRTVDTERKAVIDEVDPALLARLASEVPPQPQEDMYLPASGPAMASPSNLSPIYANARQDLGPGSLEANVLAGANSYQPDGVYQNEERLSFQIHGQEGPNSYRYGYDTGNGYNRQFRYEERNGEGYVKGRYGFYDKYGKLQVVNYTADPYKGFHAEGAHVPKYPH